VRETERQREGQRDRQTETERDRQRERQRDRETETERETERERQAERGYLEMLRVRMERLCGFLAIRSRYLPEGGSERVRSGGRGGSLFEGDLLGVTGADLSEGALDDSVDISGGENDLVLSHCRCEHMTQLHLRDEPVTIIVIDTERH
jgi:hypothetical protein